MSITSDVRGYADAAIEQGKHVVDQAQTRLAKSAEDASKLVDLDAVKGVVDGYVAQAKATTSAVADKAEDLVSDLKKRDPRVAKAFDDAEAVATTVVGTVNDKIVAPALLLIGRPTSGQAPTAPTQPVQVAKRAPAKPSAPARKATPRKTTPRKTTPRKTTPRKTTPRKTTPRKPAAAKTSAPARKATPAKRTAKSSPRASA
jgi:hypothetical protein